MSRGQGIRCTVAIVFALLLGALATAEEIAVPPVPVEVPADTVADAWEAPDSWGIVAETTLRIHASEFRPQSANTITSSYWNTGITYITGYLAMIHAPLLLPAGAIVTKIGFDGYDIDATENINWGVYWVETAAGDTSGNLGWWVTSSTSGFFGGTATLGSPHVVTTDRYYFCLVDLNKLGQDMRIKGMRITYQLQVSEAPAVASFADVPVGAFGFQHVEALAASGITAGCGGGNFCPNQPVTRVQMAVFLAKALGLHFPG